MIAAAKRSRAKKLSARHDEFIGTILPAVLTAARVQFWSLRPEQREEAIAEAVASAWVSYLGLVNRGKNPAAFPNRMAHYAVLHVRNGRHVGTKSTCRDILSRITQRRYGLKVGSLDSLDGEPISEGNCWKAALVEDRQATAADIAAARIDFAAWLRQLPIRYRKIALSLAYGNSTSETARKHCVSPGRISQLRVWLRESWQEFQGEGTAAAHTSRAAA